MKRNEKNNSDGSQGKEPSAKKPKMTTRFGQMKAPFETTELKWKDFEYDPFNKEQMEIHQAFTKRFFKDLNDAVKDSKFATMPLEEIAATADEPRIQRLACEVLHHAEFWLTLARTDKGPRMPEGTMKVEIDKKWKSFEDFRKEFDEHAKRFVGSGWCYLVTKSGETQPMLDICTYTQGDHPVKHGMRGLLGINLCDHAYIMQFKDQREEFVRKWWDTIQWSWVGNDHAWQ